MIKEYNKVSNAKALKDRAQALLESIDKIAILYFYDDANLTEKQKQVEKTRSFYSQADKIDKIGANKNLQDARLARAEALSALDHDPILQALYSAVENFQGYSETILVEAEKMEEIKKIPSTREIEKARKTIETAKRAGIKIDLSRF